MSSSASIWMEVKYFCNVCGINFHSQSSYDYNSDERTTAVVTRVFMLICHRQFKLNCKVVGNLRVLRMWESLVYRKQNGGSSWSFVRYNCVQTTVNLTGVFRVN